MSIVTVVTSATLGVLALGAILAWAFAWSYARPVRSSLRETPADHGLPYESASVQSGKARLDAWFIPLRGRIDRGAPTVVVTHGWSTNKSSMLPAAAVLHRAGFNLLLIDARGHGASPGDGPITILKFAEDIRAAVDHLEQRLGGRLERLGVLGHSIGGGGAILAASLDRRIRCVVSSSAFADPTRLTRSVMASLRLPRGPFLWAVCRFLEAWLGVAMREVAPEHRIGFVTVPVLLLHGSADTYIPLSDMDAIHAGAAAGNVERVVLGGRRHGDVIRDHGYFRDVASFLTRHLDSDGHTSALPGAPDTVRR